MSAPGPVLAGIPVVAGDDGVGQFERGSGTAEGTDENRGRRPVGSDVIGDGGIGISMSPSVWKIAPPCQPVEVLPLMVLLVIVILPSERMPPPTSLETLPLIVLRTMFVVVLKNE